MSTVIYYFSGTGNSLAVAKDIAKETGANLIPIASLMDQDTIHPDADTIGIVFPVYYIVHDGLPLIIKRFAGKLEGIDSKYIFTVCTCGGGSGLAIKTLDTLLKSRGGKLAAGFTVILPNNVSPVVPEKHQKMFNQWQRKLEMITEYVNNRKEGKFETISPFVRWLFIPLVPIIKPLIIGPLKKLANASSLPFEELVPLTDRSYDSSEKCDGCGTCAKVCPVSNIKMVNHKPSWQHHCETCVACFHWCPKGAIYGGLTSMMKGVTQYHHPEVDVADMLQQGESDNGIIVQKGRQQ